ncbi:hypothetical protein DKM19_24190 [Streptosporangium sp. 'caverna']|nr:hypothetical protein DKM19_24190 [Streptosporangium sp. 'caverna']
MIGSGLIFTGSRYIGHYGISGEIGNTLLQGCGTPCRCGQRGGQGVSRIRPPTAPLSMRRCASAASASGRV